MCPMLTVLNIFGTETELSVFISKKLREKSSSTFQLKEE